jgi:hypothetical protein
MDATVLRMLIAVDMFRQSLVAHMDALKIE